MKNNQNKPSFRLLAVITTPRLAEKAAEMFKKGALPLQYRLNAEGTASSEIMDMLGLGSIDKALLISVAPKSLSEIMLEKLHTELRLDTANSGIAFTIPLTGANNLILKMLESCLDGESCIDDEKEDNTMTEAKHVLVAAVVNRGFSGDVMDAARAAGAGGGTVIHSRHIGNEEVASFWGLSVQEEKEVVLILAKIENKINIMQSISEKCGMNSEAKGFVLSLPIDSVMGL